MKITNAIICGLLVILLVGCKIKSNDMVSSKAGDSEIQSSSAGSEITKTNSSLAQSQSISQNTQSSINSKNVTSAASTVNSKNVTSAASTVINNDPITQENLIPLYFDLLDYMRIQSLGGKFVTSSAERTRVSNLISSNWAEIDATTKNTLIGISQLGQTVKNSYSKLNQAQKEAKKAEWKKTVLSPIWLYAPLNNPKTYSQDGISFCYPNNWVASPISYNGSDFLFIYKNDLPYTTYDKIYDMTTSPAGNLCTIMSSNGTAQQIANEASATITNAAPKMKQISSYDTSAGSARIMNGFFPNQTEEKFMWIVVIKYSNQYIFCRMSGPVSQADTLVPTFYNLLNTLNWSVKPAGGGSTGEVVSAFDTAWSKVSTAVVANIWAK